MIAIRGGTLQTGRADVVRRLDLFAHLEEVRAEAAAQVEAVFGEVSHKKIDAAEVPGCGRSCISRAINGAETNALYRIALMFLVMKRLGMGRERALRWVEWLRLMVDRIWPPEETPALEEVLDRDAEIDPQDEVLRYRASHGCKESAEQLLDVKLRQIAQSHVTVLALRQRLAGS